MGLVFGLGSGLFSTIIVWLIGLIGCVVLARSSRSSKGGVFGVAGIVVVVTIVLVFYPRKSVNEESQPTTQADEEMDNLAIPRIVIFVIICTFSGIALLAMALFHWMAPVYTPAVVAKRAYDF